jgi:hypothetical protein
MFRVESLYQIIPVEIKKIITAYISSMGISTG